MPEARKIEYTHRWLPFEVGSKRPISELSHLQKLVALKIVLAHAARTCEEGHELSGVSQGMSNERKLFSKASHCLRHNADKLKRVTTLLIAVLVWGTLTGNGSPAIHTYHVLRKRTWYKSN